MDAFRIGASATEAAVTDTMVAQQARGHALLPPVQSGDDHYAQTNGSHTREMILAGTQRSVTDSAQTSRSQSKARESREPTSASVASSTNKGEMANDNDEITSDDSGDFAVLTNGLDDAAGYDLVRALIAFDKQQERDIKSLLRECGQLEKEQNVLWRQAVTAEQTRRRTSKQYRRRLYGQNEKAGSCGKGAEGLDGSCEPGGGEADDEGMAGDAQSTPHWRFTASSAHDEVIDVDADEFDDVWLNEDRSCRYADTSIARSGTPKFRYAEPAHTGDYISVFDQGFLYRTVTSEGAWAFYNDSEKYVMNVKYRFGSTSTVTAGPTAVLRRLPSGEVDVEVVVEPEESRILVFGEVNGFRSLSVAVPVTDAFTNTRVEAHNAHISSSLSALAAAARVTNTKYLSPDDVLNVSRQVNGGTTLPFVDPDFPPCSRSIYRKGVDSNFLWAEPWRRPVDYLGEADAEEVRLFRGQVLPCDPCPGDSGDVYLCSAAAILAEYPMLIRALFRYPMQRLPADDSVLKGSVSAVLWKRAADEARAERRAHAYRVALNHGGWWTATLLDDYLPASRIGPAFARCEDDLRKLWFPLLQKAYAKAHGSYAAIQGGDVADAMQDLTGYPTSRFDDAWARATDPATATESDRDELFRHLMEQHRKGYVVCLSLPDEGPDNGPAPALGLVYGMSYYVMNMLEYRSLAANKMHRLVQLRCPSVRRDWDGMWSPDNIRWKEDDQELQTLCNSGAGGGVWLDWEGEALAMFEGGAVCHLRPGLRDYRVRGQFNDGVPSIALEVEVTGSSAVEMYCTLSQMDDRGTDPANPDSALSPLMLCVSKPAPLPPTFAPASRARARESSTGKCASPGADGDAMPGRRKQIIDCVCSTDPDRPADTLNFIVGRDVSLHYRFASQTEDDRQGQLNYFGAGIDGGGPLAESSVVPLERYVYYIIPRARGAMCGKAFTLGLLCSASIDNETVKVNFVKPNEKCEAFRNRREFDPERLSAPLDSAHFQMRNHMGVLTSSWGSHIAAADVY